MCEIPVEVEAAERIKRRRGRIDEHHRVNRDATLPSFEFGMPIDESNPTTTSQLRVYKRKDCKQNVRRFDSRVWEFREIAYEIQCELLQSLGMLSR